MEALQANVLKFKQVHRIYVCLPSTGGNAGHAECAAKVARTLRRRFGEQAWEAISYALASEEADKSQAVYETVAAGLSGRIPGDRFYRHLQSHVSIGCLH